MIEIIRFYLFDGIEHSEEDPREELERDAKIVMEKINNVPIARTLKSDGKINNNPLYEEIIDTLKTSGNAKEVVECQTVYMVHMGE